MKSVCVFLGATLGTQPIFKESAILLGKEIAELGMTLIYGGSSTGLMGLLATTVKENNGQVMGIIPRHLIKKEQLAENLDQLHIVDTMHERKLRMQQKADMFIVMPGGLGTLEETFEIWNALKIGLMNKPLGFLNVNGFFNGLIEFITTCKDNGFIKEKHLKARCIHSNSKLLLEKLNRCLFVEKITN